MALANRISKGDRVRFRSGAVVSNISYFRYGSEWVHLGATCPWGIVTAAPYSEVPDSIVVEVSNPAPFARGRIRVVAKLADIDRVLSAEDLYVFGLGDSNTRLTVLDRG